MKIQYQMGNGERGRGNVSEHRGTGRTYLGQPEEPAGRETKESRRASRAGVRAARRARRQSETFDRAADGAPVVVAEYQPTRGTLAGASVDARADHALKVDDYRRMGAHVAKLAEKSAAAYVRRWEAAGGREVMPDAQEEIACIYHAAFARAAVRAGVCPASRAALYTPRDNPLPFRALRAWLTANRDAGRQVRAHLYGAGAEKVGFVSIHEPARESQLASLVAAWTHGPESTEAAAPERADVPARFTVDGEPCRTSPALRAHLRQHVRHFGDCLRVFWGMSGSRKAAAGLRTDLHLLAAAARVARAGGLERLDKKYLGDGKAASDVMHKALSRMRQNIAAGDVLQTEQPGVAELILAARRKGKAGRYVAPAWMHGQPQAAAPAGDAVAADEPAAPATVELDIPAPACVGYDEAGSGLYVSGGRIVHLGHVRANQGPFLTPAVLALLAKASR